MVLLILFGFVAGAATAVSPCVLPVLPIALSAGATGGRRRPLGIVAGLAVSFTFATVALVYVIDALGLAGDLLRNVAIVVLIGFGLVLLIPPLAARVEALLSRLSAGTRVAGGGDGFWSGTAVGASLGLVYAPCAGPILAGVITVSASQPFTAGRLAVALSYGLGSAAVLYLLMLGGRRLTAPLARRGPGLQMAMGAVMVVVALAMLGEYDIRFQNRIASDLPSFLVNPSKELEDTAAAHDALVDVRGEEAHGIGGRAAAGSGSRRRRGPRRAGQRAACPCSARRRNSSAPSAGSTPGRPAADARGPARPGRPGRLLDLQLHQLPAHPALPGGLGPALPQGRPDDRRRPLARVPLREGRRQRLRRDPAQRHRIPRRPGQRPRDLERLGQPVLAGRVLRRRRRAGPLHPLRRGLLRRERARDPRAARRSRAPAGGHGVQGPRRRRRRRG